MNQHFFQNVAFLISAYKINQMPMDTGLEVAFAGRSNVGKSSLINAVCRRRALVRVSKTPGRTQALNVFPLDQQHRLVDLPGYGFAQAPPAVKRQWQQLVESYLQGRRCLCGLIVIMDIRHPLQPLDWQMLRWIKSKSIPSLVVLNKADKLSKGAVKQACDKVTKDIAEFGLRQFDLKPCSSLKGTGINEIRNSLIEWLA